MTTERILTKLPSTEAEEQEQFGDSIPLPTPAKSLLPSMMARLPPGLFFQLSPCSGVLGVPYSRGCLLPGLALLAPLSTCWLDPPKYLRDLSLFPLFSLPLPPPLCLGLNSGSYTYQAMALHPLTTSHLFFFLNVSCPGWPRTCHSPASGVG